MLKYYNSQIVFQEFPTEISLAINITNCPFKCNNCHSKWLQYDIGKPLDIIEIDMLINKNPGITLVGFMGGDNDIFMLNKLRDYIKINYNNLKLGWYTGSDLHILQDLEKIKLTNIKNIPNNSTLNIYEIDKKYLDISLQQWDYIKYGPYIESLGGLKSKNTNQRLIKII